MQIKKVEISNFRNLDNLSISFADTCNFIVGENNIGKSNLLDIFQNIFSNKQFQASDFIDPAKEIKISLQIKLADVEIGHFEDLFDVADYHLINITCRQLSPDDSLEFYHTETNTFIRGSVMKGINYISYDSLKDPKSEISFNKNGGVGKFLMHIVSKYLEEKTLTDKDFIKEDKVNELLSDINSKMTKLKSFTDFNINANSESDLEKLLARMIVLKDEKGNLLAKAGYGVQFLILISLSILEKIQIINEQKREGGIFESEDGKKYISLIIGLDEPEIHLHPYMQRSLVKYLNEIILNQNSQFQELVKDIFKIDGFNGQILIVTHSPNILLNDYKQIVRFYLDGGVTKVKSGNDINLVGDISKHLYKQFIYFKEAFFSRCVIFAEGDSEEGSFSEFSKKILTTELDDLGISLIQTHGGGINTIKIFIDLSSRFDIRSVGIGDKDNNTLLATPPLYMTSKKDFEEEIISLVDAGKEDVLRQIVINYDKNGDRSIVQLNKAISISKTYNIVTPPTLVADLKLADILTTQNIELKLFYLSWLESNKGFMSGKLIGETLSLEDIPQIYKDVIKEAEIKAKS
ncbi:MAG: AAA family ATPase [Candidatus Buchananbacteria bacterium]|jgi:putative ATP-dependent endonuclease of OLD family